MKKPEPTPKPDDSKVESALAAKTAVAEEAEPEAPEPEPWRWTPERVIEWNAYYDFYVAALVLLLVFVASATLLSTSGTWTHLQTGRLISEKGSPVLAEPFAYPRLGQPWTNVAWLFDVITYQTYAAVAALDLEQPDRIAVGVLVGLHALLRALTAMALIAIRHRGPGKWWSAGLTALALGIVLGPVGASLGGIANRAGVLPETWGIFFLALELFALHRAFNRGQPKALYGLVPLFLLWANMDESFSIGLILLVAATIGEVLQRRRVKAAVESDEPAGAGSRFAAPVVLLACVAVCFISPFHYKALVAAFSPLVEPLRPSAEARTIDQLPIFGAGAAAFFTEAHSRLIGYYLILVGTGLGSFVLNRKGFRLGRFLVFVAAAVLWAGLARLQDVFALVWATTLALNGQEWYQRLFGTEGRPSFGWRTWSVGGRLVTLGLVTLAVLKGMTGYGNQPYEPSFGFGYDPDEFAFEAADFLAASPIEGQVLNLKLAQGDALNWRAYPSRRPFLDTRRLRAAGPYIDEMETARKALAKGDPAVWKPILDRFNVSVVMIDLQNATSESQSTRLMQTLDQSADWIAFHDDGDVMMYGRSDAPAADLAFFEKSRLSAETLAFRTDRPIRPYNRPPSPFTSFDKIFQSRALIPTQPHVKAAQRWRGRDLVAEPDGQLDSGLAACLLAIQETRNALSSKPDDTDAFFIQGLAYRRLGDLEARLLAQAGEVGREDDIPAPLRIRLQQRLVALNDAIRTAPDPPRTEYARQALRNMYAEVSGIYQTLGFLDFGRDALAKVIELTPAEELDPAARESLDALTEAIELARTELEQADLEGTIDPVQLAMAALQRGVAQLAIQKLEDAEASGISLGTVKWRLVDLYCDIGQPDRAIPYLDNIGDDPNLSTGPGSAAFRQGRVYFLLGNYRTATELWEQFAIPQLKLARTQAAIQSGLSLLRSNPLGGLQSAMEVPGQLFQQAEWEYLLGLAYLESGEPSRSAIHLRSALELNPELGGRAIAAEYLKRMGVDVPPPKPAIASTMPADGSPKEEVAAPAASSPEPKAENP